MSIPLWQVDAFADGPFTGNPAAVCILDDYPSDQWMQNVASEMNLSETAFVVPLPDAGRFRLRWFTPAAEVDLCGHATLASAHTLIEQQRIVPGQAIRFQTHSGVLVCQQLGGRITMDFPVTAPSGRSSETVKNQIAEALGVSLEEVLETKFDIMVVLKDAESLRRLVPDMTSLAAIETRGVMVTAESDTEDYDFISRFFAPQHGINEDPVTGSAHCCLAPYWSQRLGKTSLIGYQASPRGGTVHCEVTADCVKLSGTAVTVLEGQLLMNPT